jgi:ribosome-binding protein aMBF1 (putative translation factor)
LALHKQIEEPMSETRTARQRLNKRARNRADHDRSKARDSHILLRVADDDAVALDAARAAFGLSRSQLARAIFQPLFEALLRKRHAPGETLANRLVDHDIDLASTLAQAAQRAKSKASRKNP